MNQITIPVLPQMNELWQKTLNWQPDESQQQQFQRLYELIVEGNRSLNLTRITEPIEFWEKHLWDSLRGIARLLPANHNSAENRELSAESVQKAIDIRDRWGFSGSADRDRPAATISYVARFYAQKNYFFRNSCAVFRD